MKTRLLPVLEAAWVVALVVLGSDGGDSLEDRIFFLTGVGVVGVVWIIRIAIAIRRRLRGAAEALSSRERKLRLLREPMVCTIAIVVAQLSMASFALRVWVSQPWLVKYAAEVQSHAANSSGQRWVGLVYVEWADVDKGTVRFFTASCDFFALCGIGYSPGRTPQGSPEIAYRNLWGPWSHWHWDRPLNIPIPDDLLKP